MNPRISMIALAVKDLQRSARFYRDGLGFPQIDSPPTVAFFNLNGTWLGLSERTALAADAAVSPEGTGYNAFTLAHNVETETDVDQTIAQALAAGATLVKPAQKASWGGYHAYFKDPDGHLWEIAHNPFFWIGPEDQDA